MVNGRVGKKENKNKIKKKTLGRRKGGKKETNDERNKGKPEQKQERRK
jgi:hypothetical protein